MDECCCEWDSGDVEQADVYDVKIVKARVTHKCCECGGQVHPGETYERVKALYDGSWGTFSTCSICVKIRDEWTCLCPHTYLGETLYECLGVEL